MTQLGSYLPQLADLGIGVVAIAVTATFSQLAFGRSLGVGFPLLSDWEGEVSGAFGVQYDTWKGHSRLAKRSLFVVDRSSVVRHRWVTDDALEVPDFAEIVMACRNIGKSADH